MIDWPTNNKSSRQPPTSITMVKLVRWQHHNNDIVPVPKLSKFKPTLASLTVASPWKGTASLFTFKPAPSRTWELVVTCHHLFIDDLIDDNFDLRLPLASRYEQGHSWQAWRDLAAHPGWEEGLNEFGRGDQEMMNLVGVIKKGWGWWWRSRVNDGQGCSIAGILLLILFWWTKVIQCKHPIVEFSTWVRASSPPTSLEQAPHIGRNNGNKDFTVPWRQIDK